MHQIVIYSIDSALHQLHLGWDEQSALSLISSLICFIIFSYLFIYFVFFVCAILTGPTLIPFWSMSTKEWLKVPSWCMVASNWKDQVNWEKC